MYLVNIQLLKLARGMSTIELLLSLFVGTLLLIGILQILINSTHFHRIQHSLIKLQDNGQFAMELLAKDIRNSDFWGCLPGLERVTNHLDILGQGYNVNLHSFAKGLDGTADQAEGGFVITGTDTIILRGSRNMGRGLKIQPPYGPEDLSPVNVGMGSSLRAGDIVLLSDCLSGDLFQVTAIDDAGNMSHGVGDKSPGNSTPYLSRVYRDNAAVFLPYTHIYDIRIGRQGLPALFFTDQQGRQEIVEGVENMLILYGEDINKDSTADRYVRANAVTDMDNVVSVRVNLVLQTAEDNLVRTPQDYVFNGQHIIPTDHRLRRVYSSTIVLRNRSD